MKKLFYRSRNERSSIAGFTLVELMVAMVLALLILAAIGTVFVSSKQSFRVQDNSSAIDETLRAVQEDMSREIRKAGYLGCFKWKPGVTPGYSQTARLFVAQNGSFLIPSDGTNVKLGIEYDIGGGAASNTSIPGVQAVVTIVPGSEFLSLSYGQPVAYLSAGMATSTEPYVLNNAIRTKSGKPYLISSCDALTLFRADQDGTYSSIAHDPNSGDNISPGPNPSIAGNRFSPGATVMELQSYVFFIGQKTGEPSTLYMQTPDNPLASAQPLAANIEQLNFAYGVDTGAATLTFQTAAAVTAAAAWADVRAVRVGIVALSKDDSVSGAATGAGSSYSWDAVNSRYSASNTGADGRLRKSHVFTVAIRGRSSVI